MVQHLTYEQIAAAFAGCDEGCALEVVCFKMRNKTPFIASRRSLRSEDLLAMVREAIDHGECPGAWIEVAIPGKNQVLVGHHDGIFWLEPR